MAMKRFAYEIELEDDPEVEFLARVIRAYSYSSDRNIEKTPWPPENKSTLTRCWQLAKFILEHQRERLSLPNAQQNEKAD